jgi:hypothetical protein
LTSEYTIKEDPMDKEGFLELAEAVIQRVDPKDIEFVKAIKYYVETVISYKEGKAKEEDLFIRLGELKDYRDALEIPIIVDLLKLTLAYI